MPFTHEQILALAPDAASAKAGRGLVNPGKWPLLRQSAEALWGECQGSGSKPYQVSVDLVSVACKCSCPSRKFPCKHGLALLFLSVEKPALLVSGDPPAWTADWLAIRREKAEKKAAAPAEKKEAPADPEAAAKRIAKRLKRMREGGEELARWLADQARSGVAAYPQQPASFFKTVAARMVDAQVPGLGTEVTRLEETIHSGPDWPRRALAQLGRMRLLTEALSRFDSLPAPLRGDLRACLGWPVEKESLAEIPPVEGTWFVTGQTLNDNDRLRERRTWLLEAATARPALILEFAHGNTAFGLTLAPGMVFKGGLIFYPAAFELRALPAGELTAMEPPREPFPARADFAKTLTAYGAALAGNPWLLSFPAAVRDVTPLRRDDVWLARDVHGVELPLDMPEAEAWELLALCGGKPARVFGEWTGQALRVLSAWHDGGFHFFQNHSA